MCLIAATDGFDPAALGTMLLVILQVIAGLGFVIFVHELGHFVVAKACGVKCPKFYLGFDVPFGLMINRMLRRDGELTIFGFTIPRTIGPRLQIGETEYGIGIIPLGGYVKMLGQDDDPANINEQLRESQVAANTADAKEITGPDGTKYLIDKRSYMAKSVPQRMAIISAGVTMNVIFAFIFATIAYKIGVPYNPSVASGTAPGSPAWRAGLQPGDRIVRVGEISNPSYDELRSSVMLGDLERGVDFVIERGSRRLEKTLKPEQGAKGGLARVGLTPPVSLKIGEQPASKLSPAAQAKPALQEGDVITAVNGAPVESYAEFAAIASRDIGKPLKLTLQRQAEGTAQEEVVSEIAPRPWRSLGLVMQMGKITAVQNGSLADKANIKPGDYIEGIYIARDDAADKNLVQDPLLLPADLQKLSDEVQEVRIRLRPAASDENGRQTPMEVVLPLEKAKWIEEPIAPDDPVSLPSLGLAYRVLNVVEAVAPGSPADKAGLKADDVLSSAEVILPEGLEDELEQTTFEFGSGTDSEGANWPQLMSWLQRLPEGTKVKLTYLRQDKPVTTEALSPQAAEGYYAFERGIGFDWLRDTRTAATWGEAWQLGKVETVRSLSMVYTFLKKLGEGQVPITALGGPISIAKGAGFSAFEGVGKLLLFLTMLSANLAVINFLPIPVLDGGHMVFLAWEGIRGKPADERFVGAMTMVGLAFIITLMLFVISLDVGLIERNL